MFTWKPKGCDSAILTGPPRPKAIPVHPDARFLARAIVLHVQRVKLKYGGNVEIPTSEIICYT